MTALSEEEAVVAQESVADQETLESDDLDQVLWQAWKSMDLPEGYRAEIIEGSIEVSPTGRRRHAVIANRLRRALDAFLRDTEFAAFQDTNVIHGLKATVPDVFIALEDLDLAPDTEGLGVDAAGVQVVIEVVSPGHKDRKRDRVRKRRAYARAGIPIYVLVDDHEDEGIVTVLSDPDRRGGEYDTSHRYRYGAEAVITDGPAKGFVIDGSITQGR
ncbi:Uma2 family endonuclease [Streptacidiphilus sp. PB12-B1b]|uniref:Uma2 family endonuclease n=1 Tax=Streptacidiphilus sp. PB12-B1b TaxID=2705012 RepID=UPI0015FBF74C|nr:Uma2 family endonuclease [Streptacidiphilus sp. PB12-B1b]QMU74499.1 Uma2 family endonuclease [Streptacidiphilus sp. PB12-B1b]